jgi:hypothetical protein
MAKLDDGAVLLALNGAVAGSRLTIGDESGIELVQLTAVAAAPGGGSAAQVPPKCAS